MNPADLRFYFVLFVLFAVCLYKIVTIARARRRRSVLREHFSFTIRPDESTRQRL